MSAARATLPTPAGTLTVLLPDRADELSRPGCLVDVHDPTMPGPQPYPCLRPAAYRAELQPLPGWDRGVVTFTCVAHAPLLRQSLSLASIRSVTR